MDLVRKAPESRSNEGQQPWNEERRVSSRCAVALEGNCYGTWGGSKCLISELSESGIILVAEHSVHVGDEFTVAWRLAAIETPLQITCQVRSVAGPYAALEFLDATVTDRIRIRQFVRQKVQGDSERLSSGH